MGSRISKGQKSRGLEAVNCEKYVGHVLPMISQDDEDDNPFMENIP